LRHRVWSNLLQYALPDSRWNYDIASFIPDFRGSSSAIDRLVELPCYQYASTLFVEPDNCLEELRFRALRDGKMVLVSTYGLRRGFVLLDPRRIGEAQLEIASLLDGMERPGIGQHVTWSQIQEADIHLDLCVTGAAAVTLDGMRFGKGHGWFDLQWGMFVDRKMVEPSTPVAVVVHGCQIVETGPTTAKFQLKEWDTPCDLIITPDEVIESKCRAKPDCGILWEKLKRDMLETLPPLQELKGIQL
ncbi:5-formyltetrahydrofolate cyclo-ligase, partial [Lindgomyces ingoldianus]